MSSYPRIKSVKPLKGTCLLVTFHNGVKRVYDCAPLLEDEIFSPLSSDVLFNSVKVDGGGYGISWNDEIDLSESELWMHGLPVESPVMRLGEFSTAPPDRLSTAR
ncbi:MAG: DUF2442 domain-containing protein [Anaerolineae bacterium]|nr:DUF2442 domain-containing protein [Anaerolineae bacterium]